MAAKHSIDDLNRLWKEGEECDKEIFAEQRSNILLVAGEHYSRKNSKFWNRIRESRDLSSEQKLRLTKNHLHKISNIYVNNIISQAPGVTPVPNNPKELQDQKAAELNKSVWEYAKAKHSLRIRMIAEAKDFFDIGEVACKIYWDPMAGRFLGYEQEVDAEGNPVFDETGQMVASDKAVFSGDLVFKRLFAANLIRPSEAKTMNEAAWLGYRDMVAIKTLEAMVGDDEEKKKLIKSSDDKTYLVFDSSRMASSYGKSKDEALVREIYFRPCHDYPNGYFYICVDEGILFEGELPFGIFPIVYEGCDEIVTTPRHRSPLKQARPYQVEINRAFSKIAEHQVSLGDDKVILQNGSKVTSGPHLPGIRTLYVTGQEPTVMAGRTGEQYLNYGVAQISELYQIMGVAEDAEEKDQGADPFAQLYKSIRNKKKFSVYAQKFENYLVNKCRTYLELAKEYFDDNMLIPAIGRSEYINISEFKSQDPLCYQIKIEPSSDDIETMMGRHLTLNHILQYSSQQLQKDDIGKIIKLMPFANHEEAFSDLTIDYDSATNIILALDRGQMPKISPQDNGAYILKRLSSRQKQSDYNLLSPQIQGMYDQVIKYYEQMEAQKASDIKAAQSEFIPSGGAMIKVDYYIPDPTNKTRAIRATLPAEAVDWLIKQLSVQGSSQEALAGLTGAVQADIARMLQQKLGQGVSGMTPQLQSIQGGL